MRSRAGYWVGSALMVLSVVGAIGWLVVILHGVETRIDGWARVDLPGEKTVQLDARKYVVYYESPSAPTGLTPGIRVQVFDAGTGVEVPVAPYVGSVTYDYFGHQGAAEGTITPPRPGSYRVVTTTEQRAVDSDIALGDGFGSFARGILWAIVGSIVIGTVLFISGVIVLIVTAVRRHRTRQMAMPATAWRGVQAP